MNANAPAHRIRTIAVVNGFLDGARFELSDQLNCFIGARGTGKTTVLEFVRYALDQVSGRSDQPAERRRLESLVERNLAGGRIEVTVETKDGLSYIISRSAGERPLVLTAERVPTEISIKWGSVFRADIYSQNQIEGIADCTMSQLALLDNFEADEIAEIEIRLQQVVSALASNASQIIPLQAQIAAMSEELGTLTGVEERLKQFAEIGGDDAEEINRAHRLKSCRDREQRIVTDTTSMLQVLSERVSNASDKANDSYRLLFKELLAVFKETDDLAPNTAIIDEMVDEACQCVEQISLQASHIKHKIEAVQLSIAEFGRQLVTAHGQQEMEFRVLIEKHKEAQGQVAERSQLERRRNDLLVKSRQRQQLTEQLIALERERDALLVRLSELRDERFAIRVQVVQRINMHLLPSIRVSISQFGNTELYQKKVEEALKGARLKSGIVAQKLVDAFCPAELVSALRRCDAGTLIDKATVNPEQADKVVTALGHLPLLFELEAVELSDLPRIELKDGATYKDSLSLSTGQKCTTILPILLLDSDNPLLIDQPEDNLDNRFIYEAVVESIRKVKCRRQLILNTHNPNIPVLGNAERVFVLESDGTSARMANEGTVDQCKTDIVTLLEGGEDAFKARKRRYAY
ncbi:AAA family ATPase [Anatilimnocola sp. NA78]|uniref:AAA family ATPase n=1 Tax=Anatilimnocola sp. NA78 TaxID=3415683 RepID=UPI003CE525CA